jgi:S-adenosylmethionine-dependent methyltransferase
MEAEPFYDGYALREWDRLERNRTEFAVSLRVMNEFLPVPPASILDVGGGPGRYAIELARQGYQVTMVDISGESLRLARQKAEEAQVSLVDQVHANALDPFPVCQKVVQGSHQQRRVVPG